MRLIKLVAAFALVALVQFYLCAAAGTQTRSIAIVGGTLIDGTGRPAVEDAAIVIRDGRFQEVGRRGQVRLPQGAEVIDAKGKTILPGLIDGHCHYWEWVGELYLAYGVTTCPDINNSPTDWILAQRDGIQKGKIRGPPLDFGIRAGRAAPRGHARAEVAAQQHHSANRRRSPKGRSSPRREGDGRLQVLRAALAGGRQGRGG